MERFVYPFSAIVGQDKMKLALVLNAIHPAIGGVLIRGEKGTGKSTAVRALARLLPELTVVADCLYRCDPDAPESLCSDCQDRLARGETLPRARRRMNVVEREGISIWHPARFILVGTMNPEEGDLRPQLLDRFGLTVDVEGIKDIGQRVQIVERREEWESHPAEFSERFAEQDAEIGTRIAEAIVRFPHVVMPAGILRALAELNVSLQVDGHRADLVGRKASQALAAYRGVPEVGVSEVNEVAEMVLAHRVKAAGRRELGSIAQNLPSASRASRS